MTAAEAVRQAEHDAEVARLHSEEWRARAELAKYRYAIPAIRKTWRMAGAMVAVFLAALSSRYPGVPVWAVHALMVAIFAVYTTVEITDAVRKIRQP